MMLLGLTGERRVGKSTVAEILEREHGFFRVHTFGGGLAAALAFCERYAPDPEIARRAVYADLKDVPCDWLPGGVTPRFFLEPFGKFFPDQLGVAWTLGLELARAERLAGGRPILVESVVYEQDEFRRRGGYIVRVERPVSERGGATGALTNAAQAMVRADDTLINDQGIPELRIRINTMIGRAAERGASRGPP